jgi:hypothetical protein
MSVFLRARMSRTIERRWARATRMSELRWARASVMLAAGLSLAAALVCATAAAAQTRMILVGGLTISEISGDDAVGGDFGTRNGFHLGVAADLPLLGWLSVSPGATYLDRGYTYPGDSASIKLSYLEVSAPLRVSVPVGPVSFGVFASPGIALEFGCIFKEQRGNVESSLDCEGSDLDFKGWDVTGIVGAGLAVPLANDTRVLLSGALDTSLTSLDSGDPPLDLRHRSWLISAGASFPLRQR